MVKIMQNKRGWIRIVEAFVAILLVTGVLLFVINKGYIGKTDISSEIYDIETSILRNIELNPELRKEILETVEGNTLPISWEDINSEGNKIFPQKTKTTLEQSLQDYSYLECKAKLCELNKICTLDNLPEKDVYAQSVVISSTLQIYSPSQLKLFCWLKD